MFVFMIQHQPHGSLAHFRGKLVRRLAHDGSTFSGVGASGKPGAVHTALRASADPTPRTLEQMYREIKSIEDKFAIKFDGYDDAVHLLQEFANRQPTTEAVNENLKALKELTSTQFEALKDLTNAKFEGNKTALDAALKTQKEASDKIEGNFGKQFDNLSKNIDDLKDRINRNDGRSKGLGDFLGWIVAGVVIIGGVVGLIAKLP